MMKKIKANQDREYRVYFFRVRKDVDADLIDYLDNNVYNFTEYFRTLVRADKDNFESKQKYEQLENKIKSLEKSNQEIMNMIAELRESNESKQ